MRLWLFKTAMHHGLSGSLVLLVPREIFIRKPAPVFVVACRLTLGCHHRFCINTLAFDLILGKSISLDGIYLFVKLETIRSSNYHKNLKVSCCWPQFQKCEGGGSARIGETFVSFPSRP